MSSITLCGVLAKMHVASVCSNVFEVPLLAVRFSNYVSFAAFLKSTTLVDGRFTGCGAITTIVPGSTVDL